MESLTNDVLVEAYLKAVDLDLEADFIRLLAEEIQRRNLEMPSDAPLPV